MGGARVSNSYVITKDLELVQPPNTTPKPSVSVQVERSEQSNTNAQPDAYDDYSVVLTQDRHNDDSGYGDYDFDDLSDKNPKDKEVSVPVEQTQYRTEPKPEPDYVDEPFFMKVKATVRNVPKAEFTPLPDKLFNRLGDELSDKAYDWVEDNGFYLEDTKKFVAKLLHN